MFANPQPASLTSQGILSVDISEYPVYVRWRGDKVASVSQRKSDTPECRLISADRITALPVPGGLLIRGAGHGPTTIQILDCRGRIIARRTGITEESMLLPTGQHAEGVYMVRITSTKTTIVRRFLFRDN